MRMCILSQEGWRLFLPFCDQKGGAMLKRFVGLGGIALVLSGCSDLEQTFGETPEPIDAPVEIAQTTAVSSVTPPPVIQNTGAPRAPEVLDIATTEERTEATTITAVSNEKNLGIAIAALGNPAETGFWVKSDLVASPTKGRITDLASGKKVNVDLFPAETAQSGTQISLSAMRALDVSFIDLPEVQITQVN